MPKTQRQRLTDGIEAVDLALYLEKFHTLVLADVHVGYEAALVREGTLLPKQHLDRLVTRLTRIFDQLDVNKKSPLERIIINGDLSHQFGFLTYQESLESLKLLNNFDGICKEILLLKGNHDGNLMPLTEGGQRVRVENSFQLGSMLLLHGDQEPQRIPPEIEIVIIGHEHPAIGLRDRVTGRVELYKCFLVGRYRQLGLIVQPSFNPLAQGSDLTRERTLSPLLSEDGVGGFEVYPVSDDGSCFRFGPLRKLLEQEELTGSLSGKITDSRA